MPPEAVGSDGAALRTSGLHWRWPWRRISIVPITGDLRLSIEETVSSEGVRLRRVVAVPYTLDTGRLAVHAAALASGGLEGITRQALEELRSALTHRSAAALEGGVLPADLEASLRLDLARAGLVPGTLRLERTAAGNGAEPRPLRAEPTGARVLLIGLDGADWAIAAPLLDAGRMPNLARLIEGGRRGSIRSYDPMMSPLLWTTVVTGVGPDQHGVADFLVYAANSDRRLPITSTFRKVPALWNILSQAGLEVGFVGWWASYPAESVRGVISSDLVPFQARHPEAAAPAGLTSPPAYFDSVAARLVPPSRVPSALVHRLARVSEDEIDAARRNADETPAQPAATGGEEAIPFLLRVLSASLSTLAVADDLAGRSFDLLGVYFEGIDLVAHRFQHCLPPRMALCPDEEWERYRQTVAAFYELQDEWLGVLLERDGEEVTVIILSDHGFLSGPSRPRRTPPFTSGQPVEWHQPEGILVAAGPGLEPGGIGTATLFDITPTLLAMLGVPLAESLPGRVIEELLPADWFDRHPVRRVATFPPLARPVAAPGDEEAGAAREELLRTLRGLGYIGEPGETRDRDSVAPAGVGEAGPGAPPAAAAGAPSSARPTVAYFRNLATYHMRRGERGAAEARLREANEVRHLPRTYQLLAEVLVQQGRPAEAVATLDESLAVFPEMPWDNLLWMLEVLVREGQVGAAESVFAERRGEARTRPGLEAACEGLLHEAGGRLSRALPLYWRALEEDPTRTMPARRLLPHLTRAEEIERLRGVLRSAVDTQPRSDEGWALLGALLGRQGDHAQAAEALRRALQIDPLNTGYARQLAAALGGAGRHVEAARMFERVVREQPREVQAWIGLGTARRLGGERREAIEAYSQAGRLDPRAVEPLIGLAVTHLELGERPAALEAFARARRLDPDHPAVRRLGSDLHP